MLRRQSQNMGLLLNLRIPCHRKCNDLAHFNENMTYLSSCRTTINKDSSAKAIMKNNLGFSNRELGVTLLSFYL